MGSGKTIQGGLVLYQVRDEPGISLVVAPKGVCEDWFQTVTKMFDEVGSSSLSLSLTAAANRGPPFI